MDRLVVLFNLATLFKGSSISILFKTQTAPFLYGKVLFPIGKQSFNLNSFPDYSKRFKSSI